MSNFSPQPPIVQQPTLSGANISAQTIYPPGLQALVGVDCLLVKQKVEALEAVCGCETNNRYVIKNTRGEKVYFAKENTDSCSRDCYGENRPIYIEIFDLQNRFIMELRREYACNDCCCPVSQVLEVYSPPGRLIGTVNRIPSLTPEFDVVNEFRERVLKITGPLLTSGSATFKIYSNDGNVKVGQIAKHWGGILRELGTDADSFGISFPSDMNVQTKALLLGALFLIDFIYYEH